MSGYPNAPVAPLRADDPPQLGEYVMVGRLGQGGMGTVYLARDRYGRPVAVKVVRPDLAADPEFRLRFRSEVHRARQVPPFCTAEVLDADPDHVTPYLVVEYVDGPTLAQVVDERGPLTAANLHALAIGVATALAAIHDAGVVHRDLKPRNVLLAPGSPKVIDFGIARAMEATSQLTHTNQMLGTVAYMAPERFDTDSRVPLGPAADVFAWGAVIAYAGTGRNPFQADSPPATAARILTQPPDLSGLPPHLSELVERALAKDPRQRPTARGLLDLLLNSGPQAATARAAFDSRPELRAAARGVRGDGSGAAGGAAAGAAAGAGAAPGTRPHRRRWAVLLGVAAVVAVLTGAAMAAYVGYPALEPEAAATEDPAGAPSPSRDAASPAPSGSGDALDGTVVLRDDLAKVALWRELTADEGSCTFRSRSIYFVQLVEPGNLLCDGPAQRIAGDQSIGVDVMLGRTGACAAIYFLMDADSYHELAACGDEVRVNRHAGADVDTLASESLAQPIRLGTPTRVTMRLTGPRAQVRLGDRTVAELPVDAEVVRRGGRVTLGVYGDAEVAKPPYDVAFGHIEVRTLR